MQSASPARCTTGNFVQKFQCALHQPASPTASHAGYAVGHAAGPVLIALVVIVALIALARRGRGRAPAPSK